MSFFPPANRYKHDDVLSRLSILMRSNEKLRKRSLYYVAFSMMYAIFYISFPLIPIFGTRHYTFVELYLTALMQKTLSKLYMTPFLTVLPEFVRSTLGTTCMNSNEDETACSLLALTWTRQIGHVFFLLNLVIQFNVLMVSISSNEEFALLLDVQRKEHLALSESNYTRPTFVNDHLHRTDISRDQEFNQFDQKKHKKHRNQKDGKMPKRALLEHSSSTASAINATQSKRRPCLSNPIFKCCFNGTLADDIISDDQSLSTVSEESHTTLSTVAESPMTRVKPGAIKRGLSSTLVEHTPPMWQTAVPPPSEWPARPLFIRMVLSQPIGSSVASPKMLLPRAPMMVSTVYPFETPLFKGKIMIQIKGMNGSGNLYFEGKKRVHQCVVQGRFKRVTGLDEVWGGQMFQKKWANMPPNWVVRAALSAVKILTPTMMERLTDEKHPFVVYPYISLPQKMNIAKLGEEPDITSIDGIEEDCGLLGGEFKTNGKDSSFRRKHFTVLERLRSYMYHPDLVYTFEDYQDLFDFRDNQYKIKITNIDLSDKLINEPLEMCALHFKPRSMERADVEQEFADHANSKEQFPYFWRVQVWSEHSHRPAE